jgi:D-arabinose 1-dehydrogenase-like Zn-dependent alcohol dehydrogenase
VRTVTDVYPLSDANLALQRLEEGRVSGAAVLTCE